MKNIFKIYRIQFGYLMSILFIIFSEYRKWYFLFGIIIVVLGLMYRLWASGYISKNKALNIGGPYLLSRHPLYFGSFLVGLGFSLICGKIILLFVFVLFFLIAYFPLMKDEEKKLTEIFGEEYLNYIKNVPMFLPFGSSVAIRSFSFRWKRTLKNKEYRAWLGFSILLILLLLKFYFVRN